MLAANKQKGNENGRKGKYKNISHSKMKKYFTFWKYNPSHWKKSQEEHPKAVT